MCTIRALKTWPLRQVKKGTSFRFWVITSEIQTRCHKLHGHQLNAKGQMSGKRLLCITMRTANNSRINRYLGQNEFHDEEFLCDFGILITWEYMQRLLCVNTIACINLHISEIWYPLLIFLQFYMSTNFSNGIFYIYSLSCSGQH